MQFSAKVIEVRRENIFNILLYQIKIFKPNIKRKKKLFNLSPIKCVIKTDVPRVFPALSKCAP